MKKRIIVAITITIVLISASFINYLSKPSKSNIEQPKETNTTILTTETSKTTITTKTSAKTTKKVIKTTQTPGIYKLTHYGWDCKGCGENTASGYNVRNTIYYNDKTYGTLRIVAMKDLPLYSVIKIKNYDYDIYAIVLDRGVGSGVIDLLVESESKASKLGIRKNIQIEMLRTGR